MTVASDRQFLPVLAEGDLLVIGGSFGGIAAALAAAQAGLRVVLVEARTYLGREVTATLRPWLQLPAGADLERLPDLIRSCIRAAGSPGQTGEMIPLKIAELKIHLEDVLLASGVKLLYASLPVQLIEQVGLLRGLVIGNKSGRQAITAPLVVDATETALTARLSGACAPEIEKKLIYYQRTLEFDQVGAVIESEMSLPDELGIAGNKIRFYQGSSGEGHLLVECPLLLEGNVQDALEWTRLEIEARRRTMAVVAHLLKNAPAFRRAYLASASQLLTGPLAPNQVYRDKNWAAALPEVGLGLNSGDTNLTIQDLAGFIPGLFLLSDVAGRDELARSALRDPVQAARCGQTLGRFIAREINGLRNPSGKSAAQIERSPVTAVNIQVREPEQPVRGRTYRQMPVPPLQVPILRSVEVLVVGGGTSGATAATIAGRNGAKTLLVELNAGLGGTGTLGGVHSYWFGRRYGYAHEVIQSVAATHARLGMAPPAGGLLKWNIEAKMDALLDRSEHSGVTLLFGSIVTGVLVEGNRVTGVLVATPFGPAALLATVVIDATGDGDLAAFAGADFVYGAERDHRTMWYSLAQFYRPGVTRNNFTSMVDVSNVEDYTRGILAGRRRFEGHDQGTYLAPRESRHVLGDVVLTLNDQLLKRAWPDTVCLAFSNHDVKGHSSSDWLRAGLIPPNLEIEIPYRALLPKGLDGILVTGKAISATHDAQPAIRMQPDMENLGGVVGLAAALAVRQNCLPRDIDVQALQAELVDVDVLPASFLTRSFRPRQYRRAELQALLDQIDPLKPFYTYQDMDLDEVYEGSIPLVELCCSGDQVIPVLEEALDAADGARRLLVAKALALVGSPAGVPDLIAAIQAQTTDEKLQSRSTHIRHANLPPDQGAMPDVVYLLYLLGMARDPRALPVWEHFAGLIAEAGEEDIRDRNLGLFYYVDSLCFGAERLADQRAIPLLKRMHNNPLFHDRVSLHGFEPDFFIERQAYLELVIGRALARCGEEAGFVILLTYLEDSRAPLAEHAHSELIAITGQDFGKDLQAWRRWLMEKKGRLSPVPVLEPTEPVRSWGEQILLASA